jgi:hypothetical protein
MEMKDWIEHTYNDCKGQINTIVDRTLYLDNTNEPKYKYKETIVFKKEQHSNRKALCIGLNPAKATKGIDVTNKRLILLLWDMYDEYTLLNLFPEITDNKKQINYEDDENKRFENTLIELLSNSSEDIILFFGRTTIVPPKFIEYIKNIDTTKRVLKLTAHNGEFTHPGSNAGIALIDYSSKFIRNASVIKVNV